MDTGLFGLILYSAGIVFGIVCASFVIELWEKYDSAKNWQKRVTVNDIENLKKLFNN